MDNKSNTFFRKNICSDSDVSNRANNICRKNKLKTIADLIAYKRNHGDFKNLRGCGPKSNIELLALCKKYEKLYRSKGNGVLNMAVDLGEKNGSEILEESKVERVKVEEVMAHAQRRKDRLDGYFSNQASMDKMWKDNMMLLQTKIQEFVINLSRKAYKALSVQLNHDFSIHNFYFQFYIVQTATLQYSCYRNREVENELEKLKRQIKAFIEPYDLARNGFLKEKTSNTYKLKAWLHKRVPDFDQSLIDQYMDQNDRVKIFALFKLMLVNQRNYNTKLMAVFNNMFRNLEVKTLSEHELEKKLHLSKSNYEALKARFFAMAVRIFNIIKQFDIDFKKQYGFRPENDIFCLTDEEMTKINKSENTNFNKQFAHILFHSYLSDTFDLIGFGAEGIVAGSKINSELWLSNYLVKKELNDQFHFEEMLEEIQERLRKPFRFHQQTTDNYDVRDFIEVGPAIRERVVHVNRKILHDEGILNYDESIVGKLEQKASLEPLEVVKEILKESKVPLVYQLLLTKLNIRCPDHHLNQYELEAMLDNCPEIYYGGHYIGYGIKKWSKATEILKKGRISDAAIEILRHETEPITIKSLLYKLKSYRVIVNVAAALAALKSEQNKNIAFYEDDYVGLCIDAVKSAEDDEDDDGEVPVLPFGVWDV